MIVGRPGDSNYLYRDFVDEQKDDDKDDKIMLKSHLMWCCFVYLVVLSDKRNLFITEEEK